MSYFDEQAKDWDSDPAKVERARAVADALRTGLPLTPAMTALEYGCGTGLLSFALQPDFASITLADTSQGMLDVLADKIKSTGVSNLHPVRLDLASQPLPVFRFDVIYSLMTMHHLPETKKILRNFHDLLNPGGYLVIADLEKEDGSFHGPEVKDVHLGFDREDLRKQIDSAGFFKIKFSPVFDLKNGGWTRKNIPTVSNACKEKGFGALNPGAAMTNENKETAGLPLPPPLLMGIFLVVALIFGWTLPVPIPSPGWVRAVGLVILFGAFGIAFSAVRTMMLSQTSPDPHTPTSAIVTRGPYQFSRNPIYLSFVSIVIGLPLALGFYWGAILSPIVIDAYNRLIITREEAYLERKFGQQYLEYKSKVRRWL